ncbi:MAG: hypothetical protein JNG83_11825 [Opitutaceae bacterium]|nr:hypothetical protein [Opitutaceae bacterium]
MKPEHAERTARWLALGAGALDFGTGLGLVLRPALVLRLMGAGAVAGEALVYLRWVGAFVGAVGCSYLWAWLRRDRHLLRAALELTIGFRLAAGGYSAWAIATGGLPPVWLSVPLVDFALAGGQAWLLRQWPGSRQTP